MPIIGYLLFYESTPSAVDGTDQTVDSITSFIHALHDNIGTSVVLPTNVDEVLKLISHRKLYMLVICYCA